MNPTAEQALDAINGVFGAHRGCRAAHARGTVCKGVFVPSAAARELTSAAHMNADHVDVTVRFSNASGDPSEPDTHHDAHGMATKFQLPDGSATDVVAVTMPCFFVREPQDFIEANRAIRRGDGLLGAALKLIRTVRFVRRHPESRTAFWSMLRQPALPSYANGRYNAIHSFKWTDANGGERWVRYSWVPEEGEAKLGRLETRKRERDYLQQDLLDRLGRSPEKPISFRLELQLASPELIYDGRAFDPTAVWPEDGSRVVAGVLQLTGLEDPEQADPVVFDPMRLIRGIEPSPDEILRFRPSAYEVSVERRTGNAQVES